MSHVEVDVVDEIVGITSPRSMVDTTSSASAGGGGVITSAPAWIMPVDETNEIILDTEQFMHDAIKKEYSSGNSIIGGGVNSGGMMRMPYNNNVGGGYLGASTPNQQANYNDDIELFSSSNIAPIGSLDTSTFTSSSAAAVPNFPSSPIDVLFGSGTTSSTASPDLTMQSVTPHMIHQQNTTIPFVPYNRDTHVDHATGYAPLPLHHPRHAPITPAHALPTEFTANHTVSTAKRVCQSCHRYKVFCDGQRPCGRCSKYERECKDRPEEEVEAAKIRRARGSRKRSKDEPAQTTKTTGTTPVAVNHAPTAAIPPTPADPASYAHSVEATDRISAQLFSNTALVVVQHMKLRDHVLNLHAQLDALPISAEALLEWHTQVTVMLLQLSSSMFVDHFEYFLTEGLSQEQLSSTLWLNSPLAPWSKLSTRPLHCALQMNTLQLEEDATPISSTMPSSTNPTSSSSAAPSVTETIQLKIEWLPEANIAFRRWSDMLLRKLQFEVALKADRARIAAAANATLPGVGASYHPPDIPHTPSYSLGLALSSEASDLASHFSLLAVGRTLTAEPPPIRSEHDKIVLVHANFCPLSYEELHEDDDAERKESDVKMKRKVGMNSVHSTRASTAAAVAAAQNAPDSRSASPGVSGGGGGTGTTSPRSRCLCSMSTPLPTRVWVNSGFTKTFGWRRSEVELGMQKEGFIWHRRFYPPSIWCAFRHAQTEQTMISLEAVAMKLIREATQPKSISPTTVTTTTADATGKSQPYTGPNGPYLPDNTPSPSESTASLATYSSILPMSSLLSSPQMKQACAAPFVSRRGEPVPGAARGVRVEMTDGRTSRSAIIIEWSVTKPGLTPMADHPMEEFKLK